MRYGKFLLAFTLISAMSILAMAMPGQEKGKPKQKIGASGGVIKEKKEKVKIGATGATKNTEGEDTDGEKVLKPPPPPPPSLSRIAISTNAVNADVVIGNKKYKTDDRGVISKAIDLKPGQASILVTHPDFEEKTESVVLKAGVSIVVPIKLTSKYGDLKLGGIPETAKIFIDGVEKAPDTYKREGEEVTIDRLLVGTRKFKITHPDYITREAEFEIKPGEQTTDAKGLDLALADLTVKSEPGAEVYIDDVSRGKVLPEGSIVVTGIKPGERKIRLVKDGYEELQLTEKLPVGPKTIEVEINPLPNSGDFFDPFNSGLNRWDAPSDWKVEGAKLILRGQSKIGYPKKGNFRDLDAQFSVKMINGKGVAWAIHLQGGAKNYYLFYLCGPQGKFPRQLRSYVVQDGNLNLEKFQNSVSTDVINFNNKDIYTVIIKVRGNKIETFVKVETGPDAGQDYPIDVFIDEQNLLTYGNIGLTTIDGEEVLIDDFGVRPIEIPKKKKVEKTAEKEAVKPADNVAKTTPAVEEGKKEATVEKAAGTTTETASAKTVEKLLNQQL